MTLIYLRQINNMADPYKVFISDKIVLGKFQDKYGKKYKSEVELEYQHTHGTTKIDVGFTSDKKAFWIFKYKGEYYMNIIEDIVLKDKYTILDVYTTLVENSIDSCKQVIKVNKK